MLRSCWPSADFWSTTSPSGGESSATPRNWNDVGAPDRNRPTTVGAWTRRISGSKASGVTFTGRWTPAVLSIDFLLSANRDSSQRPGAFLSKALGAENHPAPRVINTDEHAAYPLATRSAQNRGCSRAKPPRPTSAISGATFWNRITGRSSDGATRVSTSEGKSVSYFPFGEHTLRSPASRRHLGARHRRDLLRRLAGSRLRRLTCCVVELPVNLLASFLELIHAVPQAPRQVRQLFRSKQDEHDEENDK